MADRGVTYTLTDMTAYLPSPDHRCTAYWYAARAGMVSVPQAPGDLDFLLEFGAQAARLARWHGIPEQRTAEGPFQVHTWPEVIWSAVADAMANSAAEHGDYRDSPYAGPETPAGVV